MHLTGHAMRALTGAAVAAVLVLPGAALPPAALGQGALSQLQTDVDQIARHGRPSVVTVISQRTLTHGRGTGGKPRVHRRIGSGVAVAADEILTTASVVLGAEQITIRTANGLRSRAHLVGVDPIYNIALLRVSDVRLPPIRFASDQPPQVGDWVITLGTSFRIQSTQSVGNVAYLHREPRFLRLQLTNAAYPGNSGGAALNARGELLGLVQGELGYVRGDASGATAPRTGGMTFVLGVENVRPVYESLHASGNVAYGFLGVSTRGASVESVTEEGARVPIGALVERISAGSPAEQAGLREGDLIVAFDRERVEYSEQLARWVAATRPGTAVELVWVRDETPRSGRVTIGTSPHQTPPWAIGPAPLPAPATPMQRISDIERQIQQLNRELLRLKTDSALNGGS